MTGESDPSEDNPPDGNRPGETPKKSRASLRRRVAWQRRAIGLGAAAAVLSGALAVTANLSEIAGWFAPDATRDLVQSTRVAVQDTDSKVNELLVLLRNQAAVNGLDLNIESEAAIRNAIEAIIVSGDAQKKKALERLDEGDVNGAAETMAKLAENQSSASTQTGSVAAESFREAGALYYGLDVALAIRSFEAADRLDPGDGETLSLLGYAYSRAGRLEDAEAAFARCLSLDPEPAILVSAQVGMGGLARQRGDYAAANEWLASAAGGAAAAGLRAERAHALIGLASVAREEGSLDAAESYLQDALALSQDLNDDPLRAKLAVNLGILAATRKQYDEAGRLMLEALEIYRERRDLAGQSTAIGNLGAFSLLTGEIDAAETWLLESVEIGERLGWQSSIAYDLVNLGGIAKERGDLEAADARLERAEKISRDVGLSELLPVVVANRGEMAMARGDVAAACGHWREAAPLLAGMGSAHAETVAGQIDEAGCADAAP